MEFEWDDGNWPKCGKHGVTKAEIEFALSNDPGVVPDPYPGEPRMKAIGRTEEGRAVLCVFMIRHGDEKGVRVRPISARYMHRKEVEKYERDQS